MTSTHLVGPSLIAPSLLSIASRGIKSVFLVFWNDFSNRENQTIACKLISK